MGSWHGQVISSSDSLTISNIDAVVNQLAVSGNAKWYRDSENLIQTETDIKVFTNDIETTLERFEQQPVLSSESANMSVKLNWPGSPLAFKYTTADGIVNFDLSMGAFHNLDNLEGIKLVGLLNFSKIFRRLAFDFRDIFSDGMTFDEINGEIVYDKGTAMVGQRLVVTSPAYKLRGDGSVDLLTNQIDADIVFTAPGLVVPLGVAGAFLGGLSLEIIGAMLLSGSLFETTLDTITSVRYRLSGDMDDLQYNLVQVLDNTVKGE